MTWETRWKQCQMKTFLSGLRYYLGWRVIGGIYSCLDSSVLWTLHFTMYYELCNPKFGVILPNWWSESQGASTGGNEGGNRTGSILKAGLHLGPDCGLWGLCPVSMETTYQLENQAPGRKSPRALHCLKEYPNYLCDRIESNILLCLLGNDHKPIDNCPLLTT